MADVTGPGPDRIEVTGIRAWGHHGVLDHERELGQEFVVDLVVEIDLAPAANSDDLSETIDYGRLAERTRRVVTSGPFRLLESVADRIATLVLEDERVTRVTVTVHKPSAPMPVGFDDVAVTVTRP